MTCRHCESRVVQALTQSGARQAIADYPRGEAIVLLPEGIEPSVLIAAVEKAGYRPGRLEPIPPPSHGHGAEAEDSGSPPADARGAGAHPGPVRQTASYQEAPPPVRRPAPTAPAAPSFSISPQRQMESAEIYDLAVVGSGGAAFAAAIRARDQGARVVMIERGVIGGTCVNIGCVPSKTLLRAGEMYWQAGHHPFAGVATWSGPVDLPALIAQKDELVARLRQEKYLDLIHAYGWDLLRGEARFGPDGLLRVGGEVVRARKIVLAVGAAPAIPPIPGLVDVPYLTSTSALSLTGRPQHLLVIGSGYIALELGQLFRHLGSTVTLMQRGSRLLPGYDAEIADAVAAAMAAEGIEFLTGVRYERVEGTEGDLRVSLVVDGAPRVVEGDALLVAAGRSPNTRELALDNAGVAVGARGEILVNEYLQTSNPDIYAAGDATLGPQFVYVAAYEGGLAAENALQGNHRTVDLSVLPAVIFTHPAIATVGLTEARAVAAGHQVKVAVLPADAVPRAIVNHDTRGVFKIVADARTDQILGVHVVAENAGDVIYAGALAVKFHLTVQDLLETFAPYLTMAEGLKLAAQTFGRDIARLSCCAA
ncbi:MAG: mercury(II) reductase [Chloroflexi bacterium]|nr:mercury(II) reductase [Chloroflexota bacterium]